MTSGDFHWWPPWARGATAVSVAPCRHTRPSPRLGRESSDLLCEDRERRALVENVHRQDLERPIPDYLEAAMGNVAHIEPGGSGLPHLLLLLVGLDHSPF